MPNVLTLAGPNLPAEKPIILSSYIENYNTYNDAVKQPGAPFTNMD